MMEKFATKPASATALRQLFKGTLWNSMNVASGRFIPSVLIVILAWWITPAQLGAISFVLAAYTILSLIADWSIAYAVQKLIPENQFQIAQIAWTAIFMRLALSLCLGTVCWALDATTGVFHRYGAYLPLMLVASSFGIVSFIHNANRNFLKASLIGAAVPIVWLVTALVMVKNGMPVAGPLLGLCIGYIVVGLTAILADPALRGHVTFLRPIARKILSYGIWATLGTVLIGVAGQVGVLVVAYVKGDAAAAVFKVAATFAAVPAMFGMIVLLPLMPIAKQQLIDGHAVSDLACEVVDYLLLVGLPILGVGFVLAPFIIHSFVTLSYEGAIWPFRILLAASVFQMIVTALSGILLVGEGMQEVSVIYASAATVALGGGIVLIRWAGLEGVAVALLFAWAVASVLLYSWFTRRSTLHFRWLHYLRYCGSAIIAAVVAFLSTYLAASTREKLLVGLISSAVAYALLLWVQKAPALGKLANFVFERSVEES